MANLAHAMWIHGIQMQVNDRDAFTYVVPQGWGMTLEGKEGKDAWLLFPIPTPVIVDDHRLRVGSVMLQFTTGSVGAVVQDIEVNDGPNHIAMHHGVNLSGNVGWRRFDVPDHPEVQLGILIIAHVQFVGNVDHRILFEAVGCDFIP